VTMREEVRKGKHGGGNVTRREVPLFLIGPKTQGEKGQARAGGDGNRSTVSIGQTFVSITMATIRNTSKPAPRVRKQTGGRSEGPPDGRTMCAGVCPALPNGSSQKRG